MRVRVRGYLHVEVPAGDSHEGVEEEMLVGDEEVGYIGHADPLEMV